MTFSIYLPIVGDSEIVSCLFQIHYTEKEMQTDSSIIWTMVVKFISFDDETAPPTERNTDQWNWMNSYLWL